MAAAVSAEQTNTATPTARVVEVFSSIQGEAELIGIRQIFVRFFGCNLRCAWCDSPETLTGRPPCRLEQTPGQGNFEQRENPLPGDHLLAAVRRLAETPHHSVSLTGGEPLLHARFLTWLMPRLREAGLTTYLETNGLLPDHLVRVVRWTDIVAMDLKPPSCTYDPCPDWLDRHRAFIRLARERRLLLKLIVSADADAEELRAAFEIARAEAPGATLTLQPVTPHGSITQVPPMERMLEWHALASRYVPEVRLIPQVHKLLGVL